MVLRVTNYSIKSVIASSGPLAFRGDVRPAASDARLGVIAGRIAATRRKRAP